MANKKSNKILKLLEDKYNVKSYSGRNNYPNIIGIAEIVANLFAESAIEIEKKEKEKKK